MALPPSRSWSGRTTPEDEELQQAVYEGDDAKVQALLLAGARTYSRDHSLRTPLHYAAYKGFSQIAEMLIASACSINDQDDEGNTPLHLAVSSGHINVAQILLSHNSSQNCRNNYGSTPLHICTTDDIVWLLIDRLADPVVQDQDGRTPLHEFARKGNTNIVSALLEINTEPIWIRDSLERTPFADACKKGHVEVVRRLLQCNRDLMTTLDSEGRSPLHDAAAAGKLGVIEALIEHGVEVTRDAKGRTPLQLALTKKINEGQKKVIAKLCECMDIDAGPRQPLLVATLEDNGEIIRLLVNLKANIGKEDEYGQTVLHEAAKGKVKALHALLDCGADFNRLDLFGRTPLHVASTVGHLACVNSLVTAKASVQGDKDKFLNAPLHAAAAGGHDSVCEALLQAKADVNTIDEDLTALHFAASNGHLATLKTLLTHKADPNGTGCAFSPLMYAADNGNNAVCEELLVGDAAVNARQVDGGWTALHFAGMRRNASICQLLLDHKADVELDHVILTQNLGQVGQAVNTAHLAWCDKMKLTDSGIEHSCSNHKTPVTFNWSAATMRTTQTGFFQSLLCGMMTKRYDFSQFEVTVEEPEVVLHAQACGTSIRITPHGIRPENIREMIRSSVFYKTRSAVDALAQDVAGYQRTCVRTNDLIQSISRVGTEALRRAETEVLQPFEEQGWDGFDDKLMFIKSRIRRGDTDNLTGLAQLYSFQYARDQAQRYKAFEFEMVKTKLQICIEYGSTVDTPMLDKMLHSLRHDDQQDISTQKLVI